ncbi:MAG: hypothetical protein ABGW79_08330 [Pirellulales bacterium]
MTILRLCIPKRQRLIWVLGISLIAIQGCGSASVQDKVLRENSTDPISIAADLLESYAAGFPVGSEAEGYEEIIKSVTSVDSQKGEELKKFLDSIDRTRRADRKEAERLLELFRPEP